MTNENELKTADTQRKELIPSWPYTLEEVTLIKNALVLGLNAGITRKVLSEEVSISLAELGYSRTPAAIRSCFYRLEPSIAMEVVEEQIATTKPIRSYYTAEENEYIAVKFKEGFSQGLNIHVIANQISIDWDGARTPQAINNQRSKLARDGYPGFEYLNKKFAAKWVPQQHKRLLELRLSHPSWDCDTLAKTLNTEFKTHRTGTGVKKRLRSLEAFDIDKQVKVFKNEWGKIAPKLESTSRPTIIEDETLVVPRLDIETHPIEIPKNVRGRVDNNNITVKLANLLEENESLRSEIIRLKEALKSAWGL